jgi:hypothetical protein
MAGEGNKEVELIFQRSSRIEEGLQKAGYRDNITEVVTKVDDLKGWFKGFKIDTIELYLEGIISDDNVTKMYVSFEGKGGCKVILKPA